MTEPKISYIAHMNEVSPGTFLLFMKANDSLTTLAFFIMQGIMYFYFSYVGVLTYLKNFKKFLFEKNKRTLKQIN
jgi:hypothetical protein